MKCLFCQTETIKRRSRKNDYLSICTSCPVDVIHIADPAQPEKLLGYAFNPTIDDWHQYSLRVLKKLSLYKIIIKGETDPALYQEILSLNYIPEGINPNNATDWIKRLLNIKAFS